MATRTLKVKCEPRDDSINYAWSSLCHAKNAKEIYYQFEDETQALPVVASMSEVIITAAAIPCHFSSRQHRRQPFLLLPSKTSSVTSENNQTASTPE
jgi:hypothetical protein